MSTSASKIEWVGLSVLMCLWAPWTMAQSPEAETAEKAPTGVLTKAPKLTNFIEAEYPPEAFKAGITGDVVMKLTIDEVGKVTEVLIEKGVGHGLDEAAKDAAMLFEFSPAEVDGTPAPVQILYTYAFTIEEEASEVIVEVDEEAPTGSVGGELLERGTRTPLAGIMVRVGPGDFETMSDAEGKFQIDKVPAGTVTITVEDDGYYTLEDEEQVKAGQIVEVRYYVEKQSTGDDSLVVVGRRVKKEVARRTLTMQEIRKIPGTQGDALKVVQNLPGVARIPFGGGQLVVRGSNPGDSGVVINQHFIPLAYHFGGLRSVFPSELLDAIDFYPGNFNAEYGRFTGGVIDVKIRRPKDDRLHGRIEADVFDAGFLIEGPLHKGATFALSGRRSYIDAILPAVIPDDGAFDLTVAPRYYDYQALYDLRLGAHRVRAYFFGSDDKLQFLLEEPADGDPTLRGDVRTMTNFNRGYFAWDWKINEALNQSLSVSIGQNNLFFSGGKDLFFENNLIAYTIREKFEAQLSESFTLRLGIDTEIYDGKVTINLPQPPKEGASLAPASTQKNISLDRDFTIFDPAAWIEAETKLGDLLLITGFRVDYDKTLDDWNFDPRLNARWNVGKKTVLKGGVGLYGQRPSPDETTKEFGNPNLDLENSLHVSGGVEQKLGDAVEIDLVGFYKYLYNSVSVINDPALKYSNGGAGRIYGMEVLLRHNLTNRFFGWVSYTLMRSERKDDGEDEFRLFTLDQTHILTMLGTYTLSSDWEIGLRWRFVTGNPQTPQKGGIYDADADTYVGLRGAINSERLAPFHQLDLRVDRKWTFDQWIMTAYLELQNTYNRTNPEGTIYNYNFTQQNTIGGLPIIPSFGLRGEF